MSLCKFCQQEIEWRRDAVTQKNYPMNPDGKPHLCMQNPNSPGMSKHDIDKTREEYNAKAQAAGFTVPQQQEKKESTSPDTPVLKTVEGQIVGIDYDMHKINVKDRSGTQHVMVWAPPMHDQMCKLKLWWFTKITGEHLADVDIWKLTAQEFFKRPDDWPAPAVGHRGGYPQKNEKAIAVLSLVKSYADLWQHCQITSQEIVPVSFTDARKIILDAVEEDLTRVMKMGAQ